jgi:hypothetical protein
MHVNKKLITVTGLLSFVAFIGLTSMQQGQQQQEMKAQNLKVLPKNLTHQQLDHVMDEWAHSLGVRCNFCHVRNEETKKMDWASDAKPEKGMARQMYKMTASINKKYFKAEKDSLGMVTESGVNCNTCHRGTAHPEAKLPEPPPPPQKPGM